MKVIVYETGIPYKKKKKKRKESDINNKKDSKYERINSPK